MSRVIGFLLINFKQQRPEEQQVVVLFVVALVVVAGRQRNKLARLLFVSNNLRAKLDID